MINFLDGNKFKEIKPSDILSDDIILKILSKLKEKKWFELRQELLNESVDYNELITDMESIIFNHKTIPLEIKLKSNIMAQKYQYQNPQ